MPKIDAEDKLDHFKFWQLDVSEPDRSVGLEGQFEPAGMPFAATLKRLERIGNPVDKTVTKDRHNRHYPIKIDKDYHLLVYKLELPMQPTRWVKYKNQLEDEVTRQIGSPQYLLVPASKRFVPQTPDPAHPPTLPDPPAQYHFACYEFQQKGAITSDITLLDQFDQAQKEKGRPAPAEKIARLTPEFFCVPVSKTVGDKTYPIPGAGDPPHLVLYKFDGTNLRKPVHAWVRDQFHTKPLLLTNIATPQYLGVPTDKLDFGPKPKTGANSGGARRQN
jgi:hypothetical protein